MIQELKSFRFRCDICSKIVDADNIIDGGKILPPGWLKITTHGHGMTDYSKSNDVCPQCQETCPRCVGGLSSNICPRCEGIGKVIKDE